MSSQIPFRYFLRKQQPLPYILPASRFSMNSTSSTISKKALLRYPYRTPPALASGEPTPLHESQCLHTAEYTQVARKWWYSPLQLLMRAGQRR